MIQAVIENMPSPFSRVQSVLTLACGHLWSWSTDKGPVPAEIDCIHCGHHYHFLDSAYIRALDLAVRNLRRARHGLPPLEP